MVDLNGNNSLAQTVIQKIVQKISETIGKKGHEGNTDRITKEAIREHLAQKYEQNIQKGINQKDAITEYSKEMKRLQEYKNKGILDRRLWEDTWDKAKENWSADDSIPDLLNIKTGAETQGQSCFSYHVF